MLQDHCRWKGTMNWGKQIICLACFPKKCGNLTKTIPWCSDLLPCGKPNRARGTTSYHLTLHAGNQTRRKSSSTQASSATKHRRMNSVSWARKSLDGAFFPGNWARSNQSHPYCIVTERSVLLFLCRWAPEQIVSTQRHGTHARSQSCSWLLLQYNGTPTTTYGHFLSQVWNAC